MCSMISAQGVAVATAMAVSGTVILLALRLQKSFPPPHFAVQEIPPSPPPVLRSCISNGGSRLALFLHANTFTNTRLKTCLLFLHCYLLLTQLLWPCGVLVQLGRRARRRRLNACTSRRTWLSPAETDKSSGTESPDRRGLRRVSTRK